jgi:hypothetical protein
LPCQEDGRQEIYQENPSDGQKWRTVSRINKKPIYAVTTAPEKGCREEFNECWHHQNPE